MHCDGVHGKDDICKFLGVSKNKFYELVRLGLPVKRLGTRGWIASKTAINEWYYKMAWKGAEENLAEYK